MSNMISVSTSYKQKIKYGTTPAEDTFTDYTPEEMLASSYNAAKFAYTTDEEREAALAKARIVVDGLKMQASSTGQSEERSNRMAYLIIESKVLSVD